MHPGTTRRGFTLVELIVCIGIVSLILALLLPAILRVRDAAAATESSNNLKQIGLALFQYHEDYHELPSIFGSPSVFIIILPYLENGNIQKLYAGNNQYINTNGVPIKYYYSPADPTMSPWHHGVASYAFNAQVYAKYRQLNNGIRDGLSYTISMAEHYAFGIQNTQFSWFHTALMPNPFDTSIIIRPATFADNGPEVVPFRQTTDFRSLYTDVYPVIDPITRKTRASVPGKTFQAHPSIKEADTSVPQTPHRTMLTLMMDGSVRRCAPSMSEETFWSAVTPNGGEIMGNDWDD